MKRKHLPKVALMQKIREAGLSRRELADAICVTHPRLKGMLSGSIRMPEEVQRAIIETCEEAMAGHFVPINPERWIERMHAFTAEEGFRLTTRNRVTCCRVLKAVERGVLTDDEAIFTLKTLMQSFRFTVEA